VVFVCSGFRKAAKFELQPPMKARLEAQ
jgi:hypothetical protein